MRMPAILCGAALLIAPLPGSAQDYGAFDMGVLGMNGAIDHVTRSERERAGRQRPSSRPTPRQARAATVCANRASYRARFGANDHRVRQLYALCRRAGY